MEAYDSDLSDEEIEYLMELNRKHKIKKWTLIGVIGFLLAAFIAFTIVSYNYNPPTIDSDIVEQYPFDTN